jgi:iron complex outermembrane receptor protein
MTQPRPQPRLRSTRQPLHCARRALRGTLAVAFGSLGSALPVAAETLLPEITVKSVQEAPNGRLPLDAPTATGSRLGLTPRETPATINVIDRETIDARGARDTVEAVASLPGITYHGTPGSGGVLSLRGFSSSQVSQLFNGIDVGYIIATFPVDSWLLDRVEVLGGAASFLYGSGAVGGAVNFVSKQVTREALRQDVLARAGNFGQYQAAYGINAKLDVPGRPQYFRVDASLQGRDGYVERTDERSGVVAASWLVDLVPGLSHTLAWEYQQKIQQPYWGTPLRNPTTDARFDPATRYKNYNSLDGNYDQEVQWLRSIVDYRVSDRTELRNTFYYYDAERNYLDVESYRYNASNTLVTRSSAFATKHGQSLHGNKLELLHRDTLAGMPTVTSAGLDLNRNKQTRYPAPTISPVGNVDPVNFITENYFTIPGTLPATNPDRSNRVYTTALYAENQTHLLPQWSVLSGIRTEEIKLAVVNYRAVDAANPRYFETRYRPTTGRVGVLFDITPAANVYATYSTAADPPAGILSTTNYGPIQNWDLTTGKQLEIGSKFDFLNGRGNATFAAYRIIRKNLSTPDPNNPNVSLPIGAQSSRGIEAQVGVRLTPQWLLQGNLALVDAQYDTFIQNVVGVAVSRAGNRPTNIPDRVANLFVTWEPHPAWAASVALRYVGDRFGNVENTQRFDSYVLCDANVSWRIDAHNTLTLRGRNLADQVYIISGGGQVRIGEPRAAELALRSSF